MIPNRYMLFAGYYYYPEGGMNDFRGFYATMAAAMEAVAEGQYEWFNVYDTTTDRIYDSTFHDRGDLAQFDENAAI